MIRKLRFKQVSIAGFTVSVPIVWRQTTLFDYTGSLQLHAVPVRVN